MIVLAGLIYLPEKVLLLVGFVLVAGHNLLDGITANGMVAFSVLWYFLHLRTRLQGDETQLITIGSPVIPWIGVGIDAVSDIQLAYVVQATEP